MPSGASVPRISVVGDDARVASTTATGIDVSADRVTIEHCSLKGAHTDTGIEISGGNGHQIIDNELVDHLSAIHLTEASGGAVERNRCEARWWGVRLQRCDFVQVVDNQVKHTMRAVDVDGGTGSTVRGNWVTDGDSGALVQS